MDVEPKAQIVSRRGRVWLPTPGFVASLLLLIPHLGILLAAAWCLAMVVAIANDTVRRAR